MTRTHNMPNKTYAEYANAAPYFDLVRGALGDLVDGAHFFDIVADDMRAQDRHDLLAMGSMASRSWPAAARHASDFVMLSQHPCTERAWPASGSA